MGAAIRPAAAGYGGADDPDPPLWLTAVLQVPFWVVLVGGTVFFSRRKGTGDLRVDMGLRAERRDAVVGLPIGAVTQLVLVPLLYVPIFWIFDVDPDELSDAARELTDRATGAGVVVLVLLVVIGAPIVEELFFRGFLMGALDRAFGTGWAAVAQRAVLRRRPTSSPFSCRRWCCSGSSPGCSSIATGGSARRSSPTWASTP